MELEEVKRSEKNSNINYYSMKDESVMKSALEVLEIIPSQKKIILKAEGDLIPNAVAVANIITENMLKGNSSIHNIRLDSIISEEDGQMTSNIEITLIKN